MLATGWQQWKKKVISLEDKKWMNGWWAGVCDCVCVWQRDREREKKRQRQREWVYPYMPSTNRYLAWSEPHLLARVTGRIKQSLTQIDHNLIHRYRKQKDCTAYILHIYDYTEVVRRPTVLNQSVVAYKRIPWILPNWVVQFWSMTLNYFSYQRSILQNQHPA